MDAYGKGNAGGKGAIHRGEPLRYNPGQDDRSASAGCVSRVNHNRVSPLRFYRPDDPDDSSPE